MSNSNLPSTELPVVQPPTKSLRFTFVQLLFSLALGQVAVKVSDLVIENASFWEYHYIYLHLALCTVILSMSWVGFQMSRSGGNSREVRSIFSIEFVILFVDLFLVIAYFIIVRGAEISNYSIDGKMKLLSANTSIEGIWSLVIFCTYLFWDFITKSFKDKEFVADTFSSRQALKNNFLPSTLGVLLSIMICFLCKKETTPINATVTDVALISVFTFFRVLKQSDLSKARKRLWTRISVTLFFLSFLYLVSR